MTPLLQSKLSITLFVSNWFFCTELNGKACVCFLQDVPIPLQLLSKSLGAILWENPVHVTFLQPLLLAEMQKRS